ncbi:unnamed protein product [Cuscuta campestris]|uniref:Uncharacterized protein n=1 Tax=Cuscuta campestris TaxID=132261 RepID=A0A484LP65_9ASTE|nr:unnamed protein product [Cuscuta campestris]
MEVERRWGEEDPLAGDSGCGEWIHKRSTRRLRLRSHERSSDPRLKLLDENAFFPGVSKPRQFWLKHSFLYACFKGTSVNLDPPPAIIEEEEIGSRFDAEYPIYKPQSLLHEPIAGLGKQVDVLELLGDNLLSFYTSSQNVPSIQPTESDTGIPCKGSPNVQRNPPPEFTTCVNVVDRRGTVMAYSPSTTPGKGNVNMVSTLDLKGKYIMICCVFVPSLWSSWDGHMVHHTALASHELAEREDFVTVVVPMMRKGFTRSSSAYEHFLSGFSCLAVPFHESQRREYICSALGFDGMLKVLILDPSQKVIYHDQPSMFFQHGAAEPGLFPFTPESVPKFSLHDYFLENRSLNQILGLSDSDALYNIEYLAGGTGEEDGRITISELNRRFVALYVCCDGAGLWKLQEVYKECRRRNYELEIVVVCIPFRDQFPPKFQEEFIIKTLAESFELLDWWFFPFNNTISHRLWGMCELDRYGEGVFVLDPIEKYVDPYGLQMMYHFGMDAYPFTRKKYIDKELQRKMGMRLNSLLLPVANVCCKKRGSGGSIVEKPVAKVVENKNVVLYVYEEGMKYLADDLAAWYDKNIKGKHPNVEVLTLSMDGSRTSEDDFLSMGWWVCRAGPSKSAKVRDEYCHPCCVTNEILVAFGEDGKIQCVDSQLFECQGPFRGGDSRQEIAREFKRFGYDYMLRFDSTIEPKKSVRF